MKYMLLIYSQGGEFEGRAAEDVHAEYMAVSETPGIFGGAELHLADTATTVRVRDGETLTTDGPFAETKEALGGYFLFEADNLDDAVALAARIPGARGNGAVEIRPVVTRADSAERAESGAAGSAGGGSGIQR